MREKLCLTVAMLLCGTALHAQQPAEDEESKLMAVLAEETAVATKTRMNGDFVPGIVTVLRGDELEAMGIETAWEALSLVPGIQATRDDFGTPNLIVRGIDFPFNNGNVKVLINGLSLSRESAGINSSALLFPIQLVDRIEVIRGPGSVIYGDFAFMGLVNVILKNEARRAYARAGGDDALSGGGTLYAKPLGFDLWASGSAWRSHDAPVTEPGRAEETRGFAAVGLAKAGFSLTAEGIARRVDPTTGPPASRAPNAQDHWTVEGRYARDVAPSLHAEAHVSYLHNRFDAQNDFDGDVTTFGADATWTGLAHHTALGSVEFSHGRIDRAAQVITPPPGAPPPPPPLVITDQERDVFGATLQDTWEISERVAATAGLRFDHYSDVKSRVTPRIAFVIRATDRHIVKVQYAEGFRAPNFFELYGGGTRNPDLDFEVNKTTELNYVYRGTGRVGRATLFYSKLPRMIFIAQIPRFGNTRAAQAYGLELEWEQELGPRLKAQANLSWVDSVHNRSFPVVVKRSPAGAADWLGNAALLWRPIPHATVAARWNWVGERHTIQRDNRGYQLVDLTLTWSDVVVAGLQLRGGVKNLFDDDVRYPFEGPQGNSGFYQFPGRTVFAQVAFGR